MNYQTRNFIQYIIQLPVSKEVEILRLPPPPPTEQAVQQAEMAVKGKLYLLPKSSKKRENVRIVKVKREVKKQKKLKAKKGIKEFPKRRSLSINVGVQE